MNVAGNLILLLGICDDFLTLEPQLLRLVALGETEFVVCSSTA
jgi:hypothetical protein